MVKCRKRLGSHVKISNTCSVRLMSKSLLVLQPSDVDELNRVNQCCHGEKKVNNPASEAITSVSLNVQPGVCVTSLKRMWK